DMTTRFHNILAGAMLLGSLGACALTSAAAHAGPAVVPGPGDGSAAVFIAPSGAPGLTNGFRYNSTGGDITAGQIDSTHYWISFLAMGGGTYTNAQLTMWNGSSGPAIDPVCTIDKTKDTGAGGDLTVWFQCTPYPGYSLVNTSLFVTVTNRTHPDRAGVTAP